MHKDTARYHANLPGRRWLRTVRSSREMRSFDEAKSLKRHEYLKDAYEGETVIILTCGPSLALVWCDEFLDSIADKLVISVKQAHHLAAEVADFHLYNEIRMEDYEYPGPTIKLGVSEFDKRYPPHVHYPIREYEYQNSLFVTNEYDRWDLDNGIQRPWGVGIMFELGLQLPAHLGCSRAVVVGFDMDIRGKYHFYDEENREDSQFYKVNKEEFEYAPASIPYYLEWCKRKNLEVRAYSPLTALPFEQLRSLDEFKQYVG
jgi:hypothetical protein